ncbi:hypothetical protein [Paradevosia shaoguanensis]|uniref:Uncharacterized protein n=1 Tax=Paradevosia shaoguanensis TaxID=1335043 RepID=A0AA41UBC3_9HYPH|nr:hypothetical protein [Paradevosia shaoguanensis]MCF1742757.1 hypothetical protein [Paradevosia shaoguanensis]MCI0127240.1 hypothetical protein [Paradevosia shaoguanensis]
MNRVVLLSLGLAAFSFLLSNQVTAQEQSLAPDYRNFALGTDASDMPKDGIQVFACGSDGGPPLQALSGWEDYSKCARDKRGLHEVYVEFDTSLQRIVDATEDQYKLSPWFKKYAGTRVAGFAVVMSMLFDDSGVARGFRVVTDQRAGLDERERAFLLELRILPRYGRTGWTCLDRPPQNKETPVGETYINRLCSKDTDGKHITVETHLFRKAGQTGVNLSGRYIPGDYESLTRWEVYDQSLEGTDASAG